MIEVALVYQNRCQKGGAGLSGRFASALAPGLAGLVLAEQLTYK